MPTHHSLDTLESDVLARIARHRESGAERASLSAGTLMVLAALATGLVIGFNRADDVAPGARDVESIVLADTARMAPSGLLASSQ